MSDALRKPLDALALSLLKGCMDDDIDVALKVDVFKAVAQYYIGAVRATGKDKQPNGKAGADTFGALISRLPSSSTKGTDA